jgi:hypothetical protein
MNSAGGTNRFNGFARAFVFSQIEAGFATRAAFIRFTFRR